MDINAVRDYLIEKYNPHAIILHGSRLRGDALVNSDYDITLIIADGADVVPHVWSGMTLDIGTVPPGHVVLLAAGRTPIQPLQVLFDDGSGFAKDLCARTHDAFNKAPEAIKPDEWLNRRNYLDRLIAKISGRGDDSAVRRYYLSDFYMRSLRYWFEKEKRWTQSPSLALPVVERQDPAFHAALQAVWSDDYKAAVADIRRRLFD